MTFGSWLKQELDQRGWSLSDLASMVGVARSTVTRWTKDNRSPEPSTCQRIAVVLGVPAEVVLEQAGHLDYRTQPAEEVRIRIVTLEHRVADLMAEVERLQEEIDTSYQELALLEEGTMYSMTSPSEVALSVVRDFDLPEGIRPELERRLGMELSQLEPRIMARRATVPKAYQRGRSTDEDEREAESDSKK